jgi:protein gp37
MAKNSSIEWCDHTFNPWEGCTRVSPGCAYCYAEARNRRFAGGENWGPGAPRRLTSEANWRQPLRWNDAAEYAEINHDTDTALGKRLGPYVRPRVFCASLADWLDDEAPIAWLADLLDLIRRTPNLDWLLLTKRPQNWRSRLERALAYTMMASPIANDHEREIDRCARHELAVWIQGWVKFATPPANVWIGTTVEDQERADDRIPQLLAIPARVRFLSCEPLLGPVDLDRWVFNRAAVVERVAAKMLLNEHQADAITDYVRLHWVICGGESGPGARPMHPAWARSLRDQCAAARVPFFFKQWGEWAVCQPDFPERETRAVWDDGKVMTMPEWYAHCAKFGPQGGRSLDWTAAAMCRVGKSRAGRQLDGREHDEFPEFPPVFIA